MLTQLHVHNLAVVDEVDLEFHAGFAALTGETGAGKSILVDALALALGERADSRAIRTGTDRCEITAGFDLGARPDLLRWLADNDLDEDSECIVRRVVTSEGRSRGYVNGRTVPMQTLRELGERLIDFCGQQSHQSLRHASVQRKIVDQFGGHQALLSTVAEAFDQWQTAQTELDALSEAQQERAERRELLSYQAEELRALDVQAGEVAELEREHLRAANSGRIADGVSGALHSLYEADTGTAHAALSASKRELDELSALDERLTPITELLTEAEIRVAEAAESLRHHLGQVEHDPAREAELEQRIADLQELARKHRVAPQELPELFERLERELETLDGSDERLRKLGAESAALRDEVDLAAQKLTAARTKAAKKLGKEVTEHMQKLGMPGGHFEAEVRPAADGKTGPHGADRIEFLATANPGHAPGPLAQVASGGELSRLNLSIQVVAIGRDQVPTLIFDEVDSGVGGGVAEIVGGRLRDLSLDRQVLCVTHLPQVASQADHHLRVTKISDGKATRTSVKGLTKPERVEEIARMLGGVEITARTRAHAAEMLSGSKLRESAG